MFILKVNELLSIKIIYVNHLQKVVTGILVHCSSLFEGRWMFPGSPKNYDKFNHFTRHTFFTSLCFHFCLFFQI